MKNAINSCDGSLTPVTLGSPWHSVLLTYEFNSSFWTENQSKIVFLCCKSVTIFLSDLPWLLNGSDEESIILGL